MYCFKCIARSIPLSIVCPNIYIFTRLWRCIALNVWRDQAMHLSAACRSRHMRSWPASLFIAHGNIEQITYFTYSCARYTLVERGRGGVKKRLLKTPTPSCITFHKDDEISMSIDGFQMWCRMACMSHTNTHTHTHQPHYIIHRAELFFSDQGCIRRHCRTLANLKTFGILTHESKIAIAGVL